ncbi:MAG: aspartate/glutamate racemase family protein [Pseudomonadota bacterium]
MSLIRVLNPNSNTSVTDAIAAGLKGFEIPGRVDIQCETQETGPLGIETERHIAEVAVPLVDRLKARQADAYVIACYSDPGLALARAELDAPVFGVMESAVMMACTRGARFGVVALSEPAIKRHLRALSGMGMLNRLAAERAVGVSVAESAGAEALHNLTQAARDLRDQDGADVVILGCAGMARHRGAMEAELGIPVIDPSQAAVATALAAILSK